jgi:hypothetical protein
MTFIAVRQQYDSTSELAYLMSQENTITVASPKLETGATVTNYSESGEDMVSKKALLATGIDVTNGKITATSDNFYIQNNRGQLSAAVDEEGNLSAGTLNTLTDEYGGHIEIKNSLITYYNAIGGIVWRIGVEGYKVLGYTWTKRTLYLVGTTFSGTLLESNIVTGERTYACASFYCESNNKFIKWYGWTYIYNTSQMLMVTPEDSGNASIGQLSAGYYTEVKSVYTTNKTMVNAYIIHKIGLDNGYSKIVSTDTYFEGQYVELN